MAISYATCHGNEGGINYLIFDDLLGPRKIVEGPGSYGDK